MVNSTLNFEPDLVGPLGGGTGTVESHCRAMWRTGSAYYLVRHGGQGQEVLEIIIGGIPDRQ